MMDGKSRRGTLEAVLPLRAIARSAAELRTCVRRESNPRPCDPEVTALFTTGGSVATRSGNGRLLRPRLQVSLQAGKRSAVELPAHGTPGGNRTRISRLRDEVTAIFTTDREGNWRGIRKFHRQCRLRRVARRNRKIPNKFCRGAKRRAAIANPRKVRSAIGIRLAPRSLRQAPRARAHATAARAPGSGSPVPAFAGKFWTCRASENKKPSEAAGSGGSASSGLSISPKRDRSHEPSVRDRSAISRSIS
jgi:hypothetical protein